MTNSSSEAGGSCNLYAKLKERDANRPNCWRPVTVCCATCLLHNTFLRILLYDNTCNRQGMNSEERNALSVLYSVP